MVQKSERQAENLQAVASFLQSISLYPISGAVADVYGRLKGDNVIVHYAIVNVSA
jgi:tRNA(fMet)-specific endonuclease VapC